MADPVFIIRGVPPGFPSAIPPGLVNDAKALLAVREEQLSAIIEHLEAADGFLDRNALVVAIDSILDDKAVAESLARLVSGVTGTPQELEAFFEQFEETLGEDGELQGLVQEDKLPELSSRLRQLVRAYPGRNRQLKAERLCSATGNRLEDLEIICDMRPVFNEDRKEVEGVIPVTTLSITATGADGLPMKQEVLLSERQVEELAHKANAAEGKLKCLEQLLKSQTLPIPSTSLTMKG